MTIDEKVNDDYTLTFITQENFEKHVNELIDKYYEILSDYDLKRFNSNLIDPIKLSIDKYLLDRTWKEIIDTGINRQRDKTITNALGDFHQNIFKYIDRCEVPKTGFDIIYTNEAGQKIYVELKNKHNTMNSKSAEQTYRMMHNHIKENPNDKCFLVEVIAPQSRNIVWSVKLDNEPCYDERIRRVSIDEFYKIVTGEENAFYKFCVQLPKTIKKLLANRKDNVKGTNTVITELQNRGGNLQKAIFSLAFANYCGFTTVEDQIDDLLNGNHH